MKYLDRMIGSYMLAGANRQRYPHRLEMHMSQGSATLARLVAGCCCQCCFSVIYEHTLRTSGCARADAYAQYMTLAIKTPTLEPFYWSVPAPCLLRGTFHNTALSLLVR